MTQDLDAVIIHWDGTARQALDASSKISDLIRRGFVVLIFSNTAPAAWLIMVKPQNSPES